MTTQNLKRKKKNNNLSDRKRTRPSKDPAIITPLSDKQTGKRAEEALQEIGERFRLAFENANIGMCLVDLQGRLTKVNHQMCEIFGYSQEELEGMTVNDIAHPEDLNISTTFIQRATSGEIEYIHFEKRYFHKDGHIVWGAVSSSLVRDPQGVPQYFISHVQDITQRKKAEEALKEGERFLTNIFSSIQDGISILDTEINILRVNPAMEQWYSHAMPLIGKKCYEAYHGRTERCEVCPTYQTINTGKGAYEVVPKTGANGEIVGWLDLFSFPLVDTVTGKMKGVIEYVRDITGRKRAEETLQRSEEVTKRLAQENAAMAEIGRIISSTLNIGEVYERFAEEVHKLIPFDGIAINIINHKDGTVTVPYVSGIAVPGCQPGDIFPLEGSVTGEVARTRSGLIIQAKDTDELKNRFPTLLKAFETGLRSVVAVPLLSKDQVIGAIHFRSTKPNAYSDQDLKLAESIASQIAGAIANAQLFTEHKQAENALRSERNKFRGMLLSINDGVDIVNKDYIIEFQNELLRKRFGDKTGEKCYAAYMGLEEPCHFCSIQEAIKTVSATRVELVGKDGRNYELNSSPFTDVDGNVKVIELVRDITEHKQAEEALRQESSFRNAIIEHATEGLCVCHETVEFPHVAFTVWNDRMTEITGYSMDEINRLGWYQTMYPDPEVRARAIERMARMRQGDDIVAEDWEITRADGEKRVLSISTSVLQTGDGIAQVLALMQDITERKQAEEALRQSEEKYRTILENITDGYFEVDIAGNFTFFNDSLCQLLGYSKDELMGMNNRQYTDQENSNKLYQAFNRVFRTGEPAKEFDWAVIRKNGAKRFGEVSVSLMKDANGQPIGFRGIARDITKRKQAEEVLRKSEEEFRLTFENAKDAIVWADPETGVITKCNKEAETLFGKKRKEIIGSHQTTLHPPRKAEYYTSMFKRHIEHKGVADDEAEIITKSGKIKPVDITASLTLVGGKPIVQGIFSDITERKQAEETLRTEKQRFQALTENSPFGMVMIDQDGTFKYMNPKFRELFGYDLTDIPDGKAWFRKAYPDPTYRHRVIDIWIKDLESFKPGEKRSRVFTVTCKDGTEKTINFIPVQLETGENLMACEDITERKRAEESLKKSEVRFQELFNDAPVGYFEYGVEGRIVDVNRTELEMLGYTREEMLGQPVWKFIVEEEVARQQILKKLAGTMPPGRGIERTYQRKDGTTLPVLTEDRPLRNPQGGIIGIRATIQDISGLKRAEEEMRTLEEQFRQSQKMEAVGRLGGGIAHDFNNLLTVIKGYSQLSLLDLKESDPLWGNIQEIQKATQRATDLTHQLLAFSRRQILDLKVLDLNTLLRDLDKMLGRIIGEDIELVTLLDGDLGRLKIDPGQIEQVIFNLAVNARDAMPSGGKLLIETTNVKLDKEYANAHIGVVPGRYVKLSVSDTGIGMSQEVREKVFEPFFTTKDKGKGTGLGLSTVYGIVKQSGGNIWVYSEPGHGTTFKIYLPKVEEELDTLHGRDETEFSPRGSETVLLVEDEQEVRLLAHRLLSQQGYRVLEATNGEEALYVAQEQGGEEIHLLLTDVVMPQMGGKELADQLKILRPDIKVLYTSGYTDDAIVHHGVLEPGIHFLQKPFSLKTLSHKVREVLDEGVN